MKLRVLIVDDETLARRRMLQMLSRESEVEVVGECCSGMEMLASVPAVQPHLVFLDVEMPGMNGFEALAKLAAEQAVNLPAVVFVTAYPDFSLQAFEVAAVDYLLKPTSAKRLHVCLERVRLRILPEQAVLPRTEADSPAEIAGPVAVLRRIAVRRSEKVIYIPVEKIDWIEAASNYVVLHSGGSTDILRETLGSIERRLPSGMFVRISRSALVRTDFVREIERGEAGDHLAVLGDGQRMRVTRKVREINDQLRFH